MRIIIPKEQPMSWNKFYGGLHWSVRSNEANRIHMLVRGYIKREYQKFEYPVDIQFTAYFKDHPQDADNLPVKFYIDGLKGRILHDDTPEWVSSVCIRSRVDKINPRIEIELLKVE